MSTEGAIYMLSLYHLLHQQTHHRLLNTKMFHCPWVLKNLSSTWQRWKSGKHLMKSGKMRCLCMLTSCNMLLPLGRGEYIPVPQQCHWGRKPMPQKSTLQWHHGLSRGRASPLALCSAGMNSPMNLKYKSSGLKKQETLLFALNYIFPQKSACCIPIELRVTMLTDHLR